MRGDAQFKNIATMITVATLVLSACATVIVKATNVSTRVDVVECTQKKAEERMYDQYREIKDAIMEIRESVAKIEERTRGHNVQGGK